MTDKETPSRQLLRPRGRPRTQGGAKIKDLDAVLRVSAKLFGERGFRATTMDDIARKAGISKPTLYTYAAKKIDLLHGIFSSWTVKSDAAIDLASKQASPQDQLQVLIEGWAKLAVEQRDFYSVFLGDGRELPKVTLRRQKEWADEAFHRIRKIIVNGQCSGAFRAELNPTIVAFSIISFINWIPSWFRPSGALSSHDMVEAYLLSLTAGLFNRGGKNSGKPNPNVGSSRLRNAMFANGQVGGRQ